MDGLNLPPVDALALVREAESHLSVALSQSLPTDDAIIIGHVRVAVSLLDQIIRAAVSRG